MASNSLAYYPTKATNAGNASKALMSATHPVLTEFFVQEIPVVIWQAAQMVTTDGLTTIASGDAVFTEIGTTELGGLLLDADDEAIAFFWTLPFDMDPDQRIGLRAEWSNSEAAGTGTAAFVFTYGVSGTAVAAPATAMNTDGAAQADLAANIQQWSNVSYIAAATADDLGVTPGDSNLRIKCKVDLTTIADATLYQIGALYSRRFI